MNKEEISRELQELVNESFGDIFNIIARFSNKKQKLDAKMLELAEKEKGENKKPTK